MKIIFIITKRINNMLMLYYNRIDVNNKSATKEYYLPLLALFRQRV